MDRIRRNERLAAMTRILVESPNKIFTLGTFCEMFGAAKSTLSEDIDILRGVFAQFHLGQLDTVTGAAGGVRYRPALAPEDAYRTVKDLAQMLAAPGRVLPGGFIYMADILAMPDVVERMGTIIASQFYRAEPDFVLTMETKGIPIAMMTARALGVPTVIVRRDSKVYDTFYQRSGAQWKGIGQAKAVVFFLLVIVIALIQLYFTRRKEVQQ